MSFEISYLLVIALYLIKSLNAQCSANIYTHCDNELYIYLKTENSTFEIIGHSNDWQNCLQTTISGITSSTIIQFECSDHGVIGGFIATIDYDGILYSTTNPMEDSSFNIINGDSTLSLVYSSKTSEPWHINTPYIANDAYWIWNDEIYNTITFQFDFGKIGIFESAVPKCDGIKTQSISTKESTTYSPTKPTDIKIMLIFMIITAIIIFCCVIGNIVYYYKYESQHHMIHKRMNRKQEDALQPKSQTQHIEMNGFMDVKNCNDNDIKDLLTTKQKYIELDD